LLPTPLTSDQIVAVYRDWLKLEAVRLQSGGGEYDFEMFPGPDPSEALRNEIVGKVDLFGHVHDVHKGSGMGACPICLAGRTLISTPHGRVGVTAIRVGMHIWSPGRDGRPIDAVVLETKSRIDAPGSQLVDVVLADGREITASALHQIGDGRPIGSLRVGDQVEGVTITNIEVVQDVFGRTYDLLPSGETGEYWADGVLMRSTLGGGPVPTA
jgi:hypothetical protein